MNEKSKELSFRERIFISDLDGTLLNEEGEILDKNSDRLNKLISRGLQFTIATARNFDSAGQILKRLNLNLPAILFNGACLTEIPSGRNQVDPKALDRVVVDKILSVSLKSCIKPLLYIFNKNHFLFYQDPVNLATQIYLDSLGIGIDIKKVDENFLNRNDIVYGIQWLGTESELKFLYEDLKRHVNDKVSLYYSRDVSMPKYFWLQCSNKTSNKGARLGDLARALGVTLSDLVVFGDNVNDVSMFVKAGKSIAMGNATDEVKKFAGEVIGTNIDNAVIKYLEANWELNPKL
jgi:5-amino-6-(5-phospho-D-ribitylamino)uracil phosphatase